MFLSITSAKELVFPVQFVCLFFMFSLSSYWQWLQLMTFWALQVKGQGQKKFPEFPKFLVKN